jgi:hypothetical protein
MSAKIYNFEYYRKKKENDQLLDFIAESFSDSKQLSKKNIDIIKECLNEWYDSELKLQENFQRVM